MWWGRGMDPEQRFVDWKQIGKRAQQQREGKVGSGDRVYTSRPPTNPSDLNQCSATARQAPLSATPQTSINDLLRYAHHVPLSSTRSTFKVRMRCAGNVAYPLSAKRAACRVQNAATSILHIELTNILASKFISLPPDNYCISYCIHTVYCTSGVLTLLITYCRERGIKHRHLACMLLRQGSHGPSSESSPHSCEAPNFFPPPRLDTPQRPSSFLSSGNTLSPSSHRNCNRNRSLSLSLSLILILILTVVYTPRCMPRLTCPLL
ncbi:hypothetical protein K504DRAFT_307831 [Pleomassaria siparia CBS 279.74]|uniref:Uncharacterized protein n=1 Tax=Pleomassaria siparia CBS 279.74 TaxID=1314801 RepID=A0A6G1K7P8_9PLEO|nr:hypothetical protein K504DRAFT_307831 [Pleomassaria siparia CBS 279.74]